ncbi:MAG: hypothetical protein R3F60_29230 [bacterium]
MSTAHIDDRHRVMGYRVRRTVLYAQGVLRVPTLGPHGTPHRCQARGKLAAWLVGQLKHLPRPGRRGPGGDRGALPADQRRGWTPGSPARAS